MLLSLVLGRALEASPVALAAASLAAAALALVALELSLRRFYRRRGHAWVLAPHSVQRLEVDRETLPDLEPLVRIEVNADGERGDPVRKDWSRTYRVLVAGGSAAECYMLDQRTQWPAALQRGLAARASELGAEDVHVGNVARSLVRCDHVEWMLRATLARLPRVDSVLLMVGASDLVSWLERGCPPEVGDEPIDPDRCFEQHDFGPFGWRLAELALVELAKRWRERLTPNVVHRPRAGKSIAKHRAARAAAKDWVSEVPDAGSMISHYERSLARTIATARASGARVIVVRQPWLQAALSPSEAARLWNFGRGRPYEGPVTTYYELGVVHALLAEVDAATARVARAEGVESIELRSRLAASFETYYDTLHFTPRGAAAVGELLADAMLSRTSRARDHRVPEAA